MPTETSNSRNRRKKRVTKEHKNDHFKLLTKMKQQVNPIGLAHVSSIFLICNDKNIGKCKEVQDHKIVNNSANLLTIRQTC